MWSLLLIPPIVYLALCVALYFGQTAMLFPAGQAGAADPLPLRAEQLEMAAASGDRLAGVHIPPARPSGERLLVLGFGGNGWNGQSVAVFLAEIFPEADVVVFHYRGYRPSEGLPGAAALIADSPLIHDFARDRFRPGRIVLVGFSIGSGVAASLAGRRPVDGAILVTPFDSLGRVAAGHYPWLPVRLLFRHRMDSAEALRGGAVPVALIAAGRDRLIPPARTQALRLAIPGVAFDRTIVEAGHNDIYRHPDFAPAMREALESLRRRP